MGEAEGGCGFRYRANILDKQIKSAGIYSIGLRVNISVNTGYDSIIMVRKQGCANFYIMLNTLGPILTKQFCASSMFR